MANLILAAIELADTEHRAVAVQLLHYTLKASELLALRLIQKRGSVSVLSKTTPDVLKAYIKLQDMTLITPNPNPTPRDQYLITPLGISVLNTSALAMDKQFQWLRDIREAS